MKFSQAGSPNLLAVVVSWSDTQIKAKVPMRASSGPVRVRTSGGQRSNTVNFVVTFSSYNGIRWPGSSPVVKYYVNANTADIGGEGEVDAVKRAARRWSRVRRADFTFNYAGPTSATGPDVWNGVNEIMWDQESMGAIAIAWFRWNASNQVVECDIAFNYASETWSTTDEGSLRFGD